MVNYLIILLRVLIYTNDGPFLYLILHFLFKFEDIFIRVEYVLVWVETDTTLSSV